MKNLILLSAILFSTVSFSQTHQKEIVSNTEKGINIRLVSLSKVYHLRVVNYTEKSNNGIRTISIGYSQNGELVHKIIQIDSVIIPPKK